VDQKIYHMGLYKLEYTISMRLGRVAEQCTYATLAPPPWAGHSTLLNNFSDS
jgi:hypothetical protein